MVRSIKTISEEYCYQHNLRSQENNKMIYETGHNIDPWGTLNKIFRLITKC